MENLIWNSADDILLLTISGQDDKDSAFQEIYLD